MNNIKRLFVFASFDIHSIIDDYVVYYVSELSKLGDVIFFMDNNASDAELDKIRKIPNVLFASAKRHGEYDFGSYKRGYMWAKNQNILDNYDWLYLVNDSVYGPLKSLDSILTDLEARGDYVGMHYNNHTVCPTHHIQSWFVGTNHSNFSSSWFYNFMRGIKKYPTKNELVKNTEFKLGELFSQHRKKPAYITIEDSIDSLYQNLDMHFENGLPFIKRLFLENSKLTTPATVSSLKTILEKIPNHRDLILNRIKKINPLILNQMGYIDYPLKVYLSLTSVDSAPQYMNSLEVTLKSIRNNTSMKAVVIYDGSKEDKTYKLCVSYGATVIIREFQKKKELLAIYTPEVQMKRYGKIRDFTPVFGTFMRFEIPFIEQEDEYVLYADIDCLFQADVKLSDMPTFPNCVAVAPEFNKNDFSYYNAGVLLINVRRFSEKVKEIYKILDEKILTNGIFDQGYLNDVCEGEFDKLPLEYNWKPYWGKNNNAKIIHYHGMKPTGTVETSGFGMDESTWDIIFNADENSETGYIYYTDLFLKVLDKNYDDWRSAHYGYLLKLRNKLVKTESNNEYKKVFKLFSILPVLMVCSTYDRFKIKLFGLPLFATKKKANKILIRLFGLTIASVKTKNNK